MEIVGSMASTVVELLFDPIRRSVTRVFYYSRNVKSLETHMEELSDKKTRVQHSVEEATNKREEIEDDVVKWLAIVDVITEEADRVLKDKDKAKKRCFMGLFPNLMTRYRVSTEIESIDEEAVKISLRGKFDRVSYLPARRGIGDRSVKDYEAFESRRHVLDEILEALKDNDVNLVGVYGMTGVGKTTIVKKVAEQVKANRIFDVVVLAVVSKTPHLREIQGEIADGLGFKFEAETNSGRAHRLHERLKSERKVLVILDDIWERLELDDVGIPSGSDNRGCKILMTSRDRNTLYRGMDTQKLFHLKVLLENEAWNLFENKAGDAIKNLFKNMAGDDIKNLFENKAGDDIENPDLQRVAVEVAKRCAGLPILLVTVASALKKGDLSEWKDALKRLERFDKDEIDSRVYSALELSYTALKGEEIKSVFLLCGQLPPQEISILDLLKFTVGLGFFKRISTLEEARHRLNKLVNDLIASCLLEGGPDGIVKMHDVLHGFAVSVASRDHCLFAPSSGTVLREWPAKDMLEQCSAISLLGCKISGLPEVLNCPKMESFILLNEDPSLKIPDCLFKGTKTLQLMDMTDVQLPTLPSSLQFLEKLQTLCLNYCGLGDIALIGELKMLKVLSLIGSNIVRLPREIGQLTRLQLLDLTDNPTLEIIPPNVLSCLTQLEDLYMENSFLQWGVEGLDDRRNNASLAELKDLPYLSTLYLHITDPMILPKDFFSKKLERFNILIGEGWDWSSKRGTSTIMKLKISTSIQLEEGIQLLLKRTEDLHLDGLEGVKSVSYELDGQGFPSLKHLHIQNCLEIRYIVDSTMLSPVVDFPFLVSLSLDNLNKLEKICNGQPVAESFSKLRILKVKSCPMLKNLFSLHMERGLLQLEEMTIIDCEIMEVIVAEESGGEADEDEAIKLTQLRTLTLEYLPQFTSVSSNAASISQTRPEPLITDVRSNEIASNTGLRTPMTLFNKKIEFPNLEDLKLSSIKVEKIWQDQPIELSYWFVRLTSLIVEGCRNLKYLFTTSMVESLAQLKRLELCDCEHMEEIIIKKGLGEEENVRGMMLPKLEFLKLKGLPNLTRFCTGHLIQCCFLQQLWIEDCPALKTFISNSLSTDAVANNQFGETNSTLFDEKVAFSNIEELHILGMDNLNMIWHTEFHSDSFCKLKNLWVEKGNKLLNIFPPNMLRRFQNLEHLVVNYCASLEEVFDLRSLMSEKESHAVTASKLKNIYIWNLPKLKKVWNTNPHGILSFQNLHLVSAQNCPSLKSLFPPSVAIGLPQLQELKLYRCGVEEIVAEEEQLGEAPKFVFPKTSSFILWELPKLKSFYPGRHTSEWPVLKKIDVFLCDEVPVFDLEQDQLGIQVQQPLFSIEKDNAMPLPLYHVTPVYLRYHGNPIKLNQFPTTVIPNLEELSLDVKDAVKVCQGQFSADLFHKVRVLGLRCFDDASDEFPFGILHRFQNMEKLVVSNGYLKELFPCQLVDEEEHTFARIRWLELGYLPDLEKIWNQDLRVDQLLQNLETLEVGFCGSLINLGPSASSFGNLTALYVWDCKALKYLVTSSTARSLVQLSVMSVKDCKMVTEIVASNGDEAGNEIIFRKLESLKLDCLASLTSFCSVNFTFRFPCLTEVIVTNCPKMKIFSLGILSTPRLQKVWLSEEKDKGQWKRDLNITIQQLHI
uniref:AAA+ ATPase domain-containing protein n=1 Tax=Salix viminalis TaxID=40686 RepID=A0A6N2LEU2_SALVM